MIIIHEAIIAGSSTFVTGYKISSQRKRKLHIRINTVLTTSPEAALLQLDFPAFLRERTRATKRGAQAIGINVSANAIALTNLGARGNLINEAGKEGTCQ